MQIPRFKKYFHLNRVLVSERLPFFSIEEVKNIFVEKKPSANDKTFAGKKEDQSQQSQIALHLPFCFFNFS